MGTSLLASEQEYLTTSYEPDCEYDDGELLERNAGELPHGILEAEFGGSFSRSRSEFRIPAAVEHPHPRRAPQIPHSGRLCLQRTGAARTHPQHPAVHRHRDPVARRSHEPGAQEDRRISGLRRPVCLGDRPGRRVARMSTPRRGSTKPKTGCCGPKIRRSKSPSPIFSRP